MFLFGLTADEVEKSESWYDPRWHLDHEPETRHAVDTLLSEDIVWKDPEVFSRIRSMFFEEGDRWRHLNDFKGYRQAHARAEALFQDKPNWMRSAVLNTARGGRFSSDRAIMEYARDIWNVKPMPGT